MLSLVIPTYNEIHTLEMLVQRIDQSLKQYPYEIIVVDDDSPDGTGTLAEEMATRYPLHAIRRTGKRGLGSAVVDGLRSAKGDILGFMDADLSHPPERLPSLLEHIDTGSADIVVGSRFVAGGAISGDWSRKNKILSYVARFMARPLTSVRDSTSGFFLFRREVIEGVSLRPRGWKIGLELLVKGRYRKVLEAPIVFQNRQGGSSKMTFWVGLDYLIHVSGLLIHKLFERFLSNKHRGIG